jgi:hypothetical protein
MDSVVWHDLGVTELQLSRTHTFESIRFGQFLWFVVVSFELRPASQVENFAPLRFTSLA